MFLGGLYAVTLAAAGCGGEQGHFESEDREAEQGAGENGEEQSGEKALRPLWPPYGVWRLSGGAGGFRPGGKAYRVEPGLGNVTNRETFQLSPEAEQMLVENGFVVVPNTYHREFFMLYEMNCYEPVPSFITTDSMLHNYHLFFSHLLRVIEKDKLVPELRELTASMLSESEKQYAALKDTAWGNAAKRNLGFFAVAGRLLDLQMPVHEDVQGLVKQELELIEDRASIQVSRL